MAKVKVNDITMNYERQGTGEPLILIPYLAAGIKASELVVFESCAHAPIYESVSEFNEKTLSFLNRHIG